MNTLNGGKYYYYVDGQKIFTNNSSINGYQLYPVNAGTTTITTSQQLIPGAPVTFSPSNQGSRIVLNETTSYSPGAGSRRLIE